MAEYLWGTSEHFLNVFQVIKRGGALFGDHLIYNRPSQVFIDN